MRRTILRLLAVLPLVAGQQVGNIGEIRPRLSTQTCTKSSGCKTHDTSVVLDAGTHPIKDINTGVSCIKPNGELNETICPTVKECAQNCALEGVNYHNHGVQTNGDSMKLHMYLHSGGRTHSVSPRVYLLDENDQEYSMLKLLGQEVSFDVDMSKLPCGMNGALYLSEMDASGGRSKLNPAGAAWGTGYCDAQCFNTSAFINGVANVNTLGACCNEMDLWEANAVATQLTPHTCTKAGLYPCSGSECDVNGICDKTGCSFNPYALGSHQYYGHRDKVDTLRPFTVVTQFMTDDGSTEGTLDEIRRLYVQNGKVIQNAVVKYKKSALDSITEPYCEDTSDSFSKRGGLPTMGEALGRGMVLAFSIWNDAGGYMNWLDAGDAGPCNMKEGNPDHIVKKTPGTSVTFSNIKWGDIDSTYDAQS